jgi:hypothetical protein
MQVRDVPGDPEDGLIDLTGLSLRDLNKLGDSVLAEELLWVLGSRSSDNETIAGFNQSV